MGPHPINMADPGRTLRLLLLGPAPGPDGNNGEALRHLGRLARRAVLWLFDIRLRAGAVPRNWRRGGCATPAQSGENGIQPRLLPTCNAEQLPQQAHGTHPPPHASGTSSTPSWLCSHLASCRAIPPPTNCCKSGLPCIAMLHNTARRLTLWATPMPLARWALTR
ncbi:hypothetical protein C3747_327g12 [Trypanosoma cruzi]|uniref:Uncharacterized protein n=1 Tax=Trypanosoma cruzi TaxID=5693 RepID=A0A2V2VAK7_TRYCR|nr:hypothetical protein C3747_327g12 [Trypanosoma cruzi]